MATYSTTLTGAQDGWYNALLATWDEAGATLALGQALPGYIGLQFPVHTVFDAENRPLIPNLFYPSFDLNLVSSAITWAGHTTLPIYVYFVPESDPDPYSAALPPYSRNEVLLVTTTWNWPNTELTVTVPTLSMLPYLGRSTWNGIISLTLRGGAYPLGNLEIHSAEGANPNNAPSIDTTETPFHTGMMVGAGDLQRRARVVHSYKSGFPYLSDEAMPDGYLDGTMVHPDDYDPSDPVADGTGDYVPSPTEGVVDDEVVDLE